MTGYPITVGVVAAGMLLALAPLRRFGALGTLSGLLRAFINESPFVGMYWVLAATLLAFSEGDLDTPVAWAALGLAGVSFVGTPFLVRRSLRARTVVDHALDKGLGAGVGSAREPAPAGRSPHRLPGPGSDSPDIGFSRGVKRVRNASYGPHGRRNRLDVYRHREHAPGGPM